MLLVVRIRSSGLWSVLVLHWGLVKVHYLSRTRGNNSHGEAGVVVRVRCKVAMLFCVWTRFRLIIEEW